LFSRVGHSRRCAQRIMAYEVSTSQNMFPQPVLYSFTGSPALINFAFPPLKNELARRLGPPCICLPRNVFQSNDQQRGAGIMCPNEAAPSPGFHSPEEHSTDTPAPLTLMQRSLASARSLAPVHFVRHNRDGALLSSVPKAFYVRALPQCRAV
jgi:hypothetical protein